MGKKEKIVEHIKEIYNPVAMVLTGSRASKEFSLTSDWDFYVFTDKEFEWGFDSFEGEAIDISIEKYPVGDDFIFDTNYHPEQFLEVVFDMSGGWLEDAVQRTRKKYLIGPEDISGNEYQRLKKVMMRYIQKVESRKDLHGQSFYYLGIYYQIALRLWFQFQNKWPLSPHGALSFIEKNDSNFSKLLMGISESKDVDVQLVSAKSIYGLLFKK
jgi:hypothetical protein